MTSKGDTSHQSQIRRDCTEVTASNVGSSQCTKCGITLYERQGDIVSTANEWIGVPILDVKPHGKAVLKV